MLVRPEKPITETIAKLSLRDRTIYIEFKEKLTIFNDLAKAHNFRWNYPNWVRTPGNLAGSAKDRMIEIANAIMAHGFIVDFQDETIIQAAIDGNFIPETKRWILTGKGQYEGWLKIYWGKDEDFWTLARRIAGNKYDADTKCVVVPPEHYAEVVDFARIYDFSIHDNAKKIIEAAQIRIETAIIANVSERKPSEPKQTRSKLSIPDTVEIPDKFIDTPYYDFETTTPLYVHQQTAVDKLSPVKIGALFMEMGTGKTRVAIELAKLRAHRIYNIVWFCPVSLKDTIAEELRKHSTCKSVYVFDENTDINNLPNVFWYIIGIESMSSSDRIVLTTSRVIKNKTFVIIDESSYIKGHDAIRTKRITALSKHAEYKLILTGTPLSQGISDLFSQMYFLSPDILGYRSFYSFAHNHLEYSEKFPGLVIRSHNVGWLAAKMQPYTYQVTKAECLSLPDKIYNSYYFGMTTEQRKLYEQAKDEILPDDLDFEIDSYTIFKLFSALQQITCGFWNKKNSTIEVENKRLEMLDFVLSEIPQDAKVIIWCKFIYSIKRITDYLNDVSPGSAIAFYGKLSPKQRTEELERFKSNARFLVATQSTGGHGLTLNEAHYVIFYENEFKYSSRLQAEDRCHRIGQENKVTYIDIVCNNSIDERISSSLAKKEDVVKAFKHQIDKVKDVKRKQVEDMLRSL